MIWYWDGNSWHFVRAGDSFTYMDLKRDYPQACFAYDKTIRLHKREWA